MNNLLLQTENNFKLIQLDMNGKSKSFKVGEELNQFGKTLNNQ